MTRIRRSATSDLPTYILGRIAFAPSGCWEWQRRIAANGYGQAAMPPELQKTARSVGAHRLSYIAFKGPIPDGMEIDHLCRNRCCVNPNHLEAVTRLTNARRAAPYAPPPRTGCRKGHGDEQLKRQGKQNVCALCQRARVRIKAGWPVDAAFTTPPSYGNKGYSQ